jgi:aspartate/methionine/tyrosine aminotransferase
MPSLPAHITDMPRSGIREIMDLAWQIGDVTHLEVGEPDFETPAHVCEAAAQAAVSGATRYTPNAGVMPLREALADKVRSRNGIEADASQIVVSAGAVQALYASLVTIAAPGDEILLPDPGWPNFRMMANLLGVTPVFYPLRPEHGFRPDPDEVESLVTERTRIMLLNTPSNPLGVVLDADALVPLLDVASRHDLWVVSDECYDELYFDQPVVSPASLGHDASVITAYSFSKTYAMTGWRVGYAVVPPAVAADLAKVQEPIISCVNAVAQQAALAAVGGPQQCVADMRDAYRHRRDVALETAEAGGLRCVRPDGAFYLWVDVRDAGVTSHELALALVLDDLVAVAPGTAFGDVGEGWLRVSLANNEDAVARGVEAIARRCRH